MLYYFYVTNQLKFKKKPLQISDVRIDVFTECTGSKIKISAFQKTIIGNLYFNKGFFLCEKKRYGLVTR